MTFSSILSHSFPRSHCQRLHHLEVTYSDMLFFSHYFLSFLLPLQKYFIKTSSPSTSPSPPVFISFPVHLHFMVISISFLQIPSVPLHHSFHNNTSSIGWNQSFIHLPSPCPFPNGILPIIQTCFCTPTWGSSPLTPPSHHLRLSQSRLYENLYTHFYLIVFLFALQPVPIWFSLLPLHQNSSC